MAGIIQRRRKWFPTPSNVIKNPVAKAMQWTGSAISPEFSTDVSNCTVVATAQTDIGSYSAEVTPNTGYTWYDATTVTKTVTWTIIKRYLDEPTFDTLTFAGDGETHSPTVTNTPSIVGYTISGTTSSAEPGDHVITFTPNSTHQWRDGTTTAKSYTWTIGDITLDFNVPTFVTSSYTWDGTTVTPVLNNADKLVATITSQSAAGTYSVSVTPKSGYLWSDGGNASKTATWTIERASLGDNAPVTTQTSSTYTGSLITLSATDNYYTITGNTGTNAGDYTATFTPDSNHCWSNGTYAAKSVSWTIAKASLTSLSPTWTGTSFTFDGAEHVPAIGNSDASYIIVNAVAQWSCGSYAASARPDDNHTWSDGSTTVYSTTWTVVAWEATSGSGTFTLQAERAISIYIKGGSGSGSRPSASVSATYDASSYTATATVTLHASVSGSGGSSATYTVTLAAGSYSYSVGSGGSCSAYSNTADLNSSTTTASLSCSSATGGAGGSTTFGSYSVSGGAGGSGDGTAYSTTISAENVSYGSYTEGYSHCRIYSSSSVGYVELYSKGGSGSNGKITISG